MEMEKGRIVSGRRDGVIKNVSHVFEPRDQRYQRKEVNF